jgi:putative tryptophan/tyrosine transport system substrate-binding protein
MVIARLLLLLTVASNFALATTFAHAQQADRVPTVAFLAGAVSSDDPIFEALRQGLRELGYVEGRTIRMEFRTAEGHDDRLTHLAQELVQLKANVIVVGTPQAARAIQRVSSTTPIVTTLFDPLAAGLVTDIAHPGGTITGLSSMSPELSAKRLQLLRNALPRLKRVAVVSSPGSLTLNGAKMIEDLKAAALSMSLDLKFVNARTTQEFGPAFSAANETHAQAVYLFESALFYSERITLARLALQSRLPAIYGTRAFAEEGGLMSYGVNYPDQLRRAADYVDKILKGAKPGDLPIAQPTSFELVVNLKTAKMLGITIPESIVLRADEVIR